MFIVRSDIPIPSKDDPRRRKPFVYPFDQMEVGDSFDAPRDRGVYKDGTDARQRAIATCAYQYRTRYKPEARFITRSIDKETIRCWRIA